jgi:capsular polysaccharide biosynthesis protein
MLTSAALVLLPQSVRSVATQVVVADSSAVLSAALPRISPPVPLETLDGEVQVKSVTSYVISFVAKGKDAARAEATANAVARSYVAYVTSPSSPVGHVSAQMLEPATSATGPSPLRGLLTYGIAGLLAGALIGIVGSLAISRNDRRLRERDEIASSIGIPVLASIPVAHPSDARGWATLLGNYKPAAVHAWRLRKALQQIGVPGESQSNGRVGGISSLVVLSLSSDPKALAIGPQLAVFTASLGIPTALVIGPQQDKNATAALRTAGVAEQSESSRLSDYLRVTVSDYGDVGVQPGELAVIVTVVDSWTPQIPETIGATTTLLGVSVGAATADQLARVAVSASTDGREIVGILVADPDPSDHTTGYMPQIAQPIRRKVPTRLSSFVTEMRR